MQFDEFRINVDDPIEQKITQEKQGSTSHHDQLHKTFSFKDFCDQVSDKKMLRKLSEHNHERHGKYPNWTPRQRVPEVLQRNKEFKQYYKPMEFSVGPLHAADVKLSQAQLKIKLAARFVKESGHTAEDLFEEVKKNLQELKTYFDDQEIISFNDENLARLLFIDGCAILQFIDSYVNRSLNEFSINNGQAELIQQDLFLLESQIPFKVLQLLMGMKAQKNRTMGKENLVEFLLDNGLMELVQPTRHEACKYLLDMIDGHCDESKAVIHLLDLLRSLLVMDSCDTRKPFRISFWTSLRLCACTFSGCWLICLPFYALNAFENVFNNILTCFDRDHWHQQQSFRNVDELKSVGITLRPSRSCSLRDISFHKHWFLRGHVRLPPLLVDGSTARKMLNLVAYEMCIPDYQHKCYVTSYINLMCLLIEDEKDVKLLRSTDVLRNRLSTDTEVAILLNKIGSTCLSPPTDTYLGVKSDIEDHYKRKLSIWMAQVYYVHFSSPWTILALLATMTVLLLTAIQTWYAIHPRPN